MITACTLHYVLHFGFCHVSFGISLSWSFLELAICENQVLKYDEYFLVGSELTTAWIKKKILDV